MRSLPPKWRVTHDDNGSMIIALFAIMILTSLVSIVLMATISQQVKTRKATDFTFAGQAADTAVNDALLMANLNMDGVLDPAVAVHDVATYSPANPRTGVTGDFMWSWSAVPALDPTPTWTVTATGCRNQNKGTTDPPACSASSSRTITATLTGTPTGDPVSGGQTAYVLTPDFGFSRALFADQDLIMQGASTQVTSYNSDTSALVTGYGYVASNGLASFSPGVTLDGIFMSNTQAQPSGERCTGVQCNADLIPRRLIHDLHPKLKIDDVQFIDDKIADCAGQPGGLVPWVASKAPITGHLNAGSQCYSSVTFDVNTSVDGTPDTPTLVYVNGPVTVDPGVKVNMPNQTPAAKTLEILSSGTVVSVDGGDTAATVTEAAWVLWAPKALCATNPAAGFVTLYGSTVCQKISTQGTFKAMWDEALRITPADHPGVATVWDTTGYQDQGAHPAP